MRVAFIARATLFTGKGGDTFQLIQTARHLERHGIQADIKLAGEAVDYGRYDLLHFFNITRPADILHHIQQTTTPFIVSPILVDYTEYDKYHRKGFSGWLFSLLSPGRIEYLKTIARWIKGKDRPVSFSYIWKGHRKSVRQILSKALWVLPNSEMEYRQLCKQYRVSPNYTVVPNGVDTSLFKQSADSRKEEQMVLCVARVEGVKNQLNLVKALNNTPYQLVIVGDAAPNQPSYYQQCRNMAASNVTFMNSLPQQELVAWYAKAKVHILPSWFETCGLATLEAAVMGCNVVVSDRGFTSEYCEDDAVYCDPSSPSALLKAVEKAASNRYNEKLRERILTKYTWQIAAAHTAEAYKQAVQTI